MKSTTEQTHKSRLQLKKRISSANFVTKKMKSILTTRQTYDQAMIKHTNDHSNTQITTTTKMNERSIKQNNFINQRKSDHLQKQSNKGLIEFIKNNKLEKNKEQSALMKNCDKTKLIFWNNDLILKGNEKYLILSADLIINQDCFWDKTTSDNGKFYPNSLYINNTLSTLNHNTTSTFRVKNQNLCPPKQTSNTSIGNNLSSTSKRNPLLNPSTINSFVKEWKNLHNKYDANNNKLIVIWIIRKQSTYNQIMEVIKFYQLPVHAIFYTKRRRGNYFFDINPIVKEIYHRFFQSIVHPKKQNISQRAEKSHQKNGLNKSKSRQFVRYDSKCQTKYLSKTISQQLKKQFGSITNRIGTIKRQEINSQQNDQNSINTLNTMKPKQFELSKNNNIRNAVFQNQTKLFTIKMRKVHPSSASRIRSTTIKLKNILRDNQQMGQIERIQLDVSPVLQKRNNYDHKQTQDTTNEVQVGQNINPITHKFIKPQIFIYEGIKCNSKDLCTFESYFGKVPLLFSHQQEIYIQNRKKVESDLQIKIHQNQNKNQIKVFYLNYQQIQENILETINYNIKNQLKRLPLTSIQSYSYKAPKIKQFFNMMVSATLKQLAQHLTSKQKRLIPSSNQISQPLQQQIELNQQEQEKIIQKTQKKLDQIRKKMIDDVIKVKGRNYTFQNGESVYYYVGDIFKRNYNFFYEDYYKRYEKEYKQQMKNKNNSKLRKNGGQTSRMELGKIEEKLMINNKTKCQQKIKDNYQIKSESLKLGEICFYEFS